MCMCNECHCNDDDREAEQDLAVAEAKGQFHKVKVHVTIEAIIDVPGASHTTEDLRNHLDDCLADGEIIDWGEV